MSWASSGSGETLTPAPPRREQVLWRPRQVRGLGWGHPCRGPVVWLPETRPWAEVRVTQGVARDGEAGQGWGAAGGEGSWRPGPCRGPADADTPMPCRRNSTAGPAWGRRWGVGVALNDADPGQTLDDPLPFLKHCACPPCVLLLAATGPFSRLVGRHWLPELSVVTWTARMNRKDEPQG